ncbi:MAG: AP2/ERF family transcription factor, partial [Planctomycetota bacterium]
RQSGVVGVNWCETNKGWVSRLMVNGKGRSEFFAIKNHGEDDALRFAIQARKEMEARVPHFENPKDAQIKFSLAGVLGLKKED